MLVRMKKRGDLTVLVVLFQQPAVSFSVSGPEMLGLYINRSSYADVISWGCHTTHLMTDPKNIGSLYGVHGAERPVLHTLQKWEFQESSEVGRAGNRATNGMSKTQSYLLGHSGFWILMCNITPRGDLINRICDKPPKL